MRKGRGENTRWSFYVETRSRGEKERMDVANDTVERKRRTDGFVGVDVEARTESE